MTERIGFYINDLPFLPEPYHLKGVGLPCVYLLNGVSFESHPDYGELVTIENLDGLHRAIGLHIIEKQTPMTGADVRFLRKQMILTQSQLARYLRITPQTVANYEKEKTEIGPADSAVRLLYAAQAFPPETTTKVMKCLTDALTDTTPKLRLPELSRRRITGRWKEQLAA